MIDILLILQRYNVLTTHLGESWTHNSCLGLVLFLTKIAKNAFFFVETRQNLYLTMIFDLSDTDIHMSFALFNIFNYFIMYFG